MINDFSKIPGFSIFAGKRGQLPILLKVVNVVVLYLDVVDGGHFHKVFSNVLYNYPALRAPLLHEEGELLFLE